MISCPLFWLPEGCIDGTLSPCAHLPKPQLHSYRPVGRCPRHRDVQLLHRRQRLRFLKAVEHVFPLRQLLGVGPVVHLQVVQEVAPGLEPAFKPQQWNRESVVSLCHFCVFFFAQTLTLAQFRKILFGWAFFVSIRNVPDSPNLHIPCSDAL